MRFIEKLKLMRCIYRNNFHFRVFVKNLSKYITLQYCSNVLLQYKYNKKWTLTLLEFCNNDSAIFCNHHEILQRFSEIILQCFRNLSVLCG